MAGNAPISARQLRPQVGSIFFHPESGRTALPSPCCWQMKIVAVTNQKGGVGKTTTSINLSAALAMVGQRVLLVDLDPQANATGVLGPWEDVGSGLYGTLVGSQPIEDAILPTRLPNLSCLPASLDLAGAEVEVARMEGHLFQLRETLSPIRSAGNFDFILLDCPPSLGILMSNALVAADELLIPIQCEYYALTGLSLLMQVAGQIRDCQANSNLAINGILMTMLDSRTNLNTAVVEDVRGHFEEVVYRTSIPRTVRFGEAPSHGLTIHEYDGNCAGARAYQDLATEFLERQNAGLAYQIPEARISDEELPSTPAL